jgi:hypothetical protein
MALMNLRDDIELSVLAETGDAHYAECVGAAFQYTQDAMCWAMGIDPAWLNEPIA